MVDLLLLILQIFQLLLLARALLSFFPNVDYSNPIIKLVFDVTEPILKPIREMLPSGSGIDFSPLVVYIIIILLSQLLIRFF